jgi:hypothetical protein
MDTLNSSLSIATQVPHGEDTQLRQPQQNGKEMQYPGCLLLIYSGDILLSESLRWQMRVLQEEQKVLLKEAPL